MKMMISVFTLCLVVSCIVFAQTPAAQVASPVAAIVAPVVPFSLLAFVKANWGQICFALSWLIEGIFYFSPSLKANSFLEQVELWIKGQSVTPTL